MESGANLYRSDFVPVSCNYPVRLSAAKIRFAQSNFSSCPNSKVTFHIVTSLWVNFKNLVNQALSKPSWKQSKNICPLTALFKNPRIQSQFNDHKQQTLKHRNTQNGSRSTNHKSQTMTVNLKQEIISQGDWELIVNMTILETWNKTWASYLRHSREANAW